MRERLPNSGDVRKSRKSTEALAILTTSGLSDARRINFRYIKESLRGITVVPILYTRFYRPNVGFPLDDFFLLLNVSMALAKTFIRCTTLNPVRAVPGA